ncbi:hypothetical protein AMJ49_06085 [Parcubacteria bacterium DG_74_2]|nr:MAG: hypothetical protein AMJ49_06085 [Parcubacteria bacterium DG_74_2]
MRVHSIEKIEKLKKLRKKGLSINEIVRELSVPKTTVWHHIQDVQVSAKYVPILRAKRGGSAKRKEKNLKEAQKCAQKLLQGPNRDILIMIAMLYWGEGTKKVCEFINSDGKIIKSYLTGLRKVFNIPEKSIKPTIRIYAGMNKKECLNYWSCVTKIPKHKFTIRFNDGGTKGRTKYGMCRITVKKGGNFLKLIKSLIDQIFKELIKTYNN